MSAINAVGAEPSGIAAPTPAALELPDEVLRCIINHVPSHAHSLFNSLSLINKATHALVRSVRYRELHLPDATAAHLLLDNSDSNTRNLIRSQLREVSFGPRASKEGQDVISDAPFAECLAFVGPDQLERLAVRGCKLSGALFWAIRHSLTSLELSQCVIGFRPSELRLRQLAHLTLRDVSHASPGTEWDDFLRLAALPSLTCLSLQHELPSLRTEPDRRAALHLLAPRLTSLAVDDNQAWLSADDIDVWPLLTSLESLAIVEPLNAGQDDEIGHLLVNALHSLPRSLARLSIATRRASFTVSAWNVCFALRERLPAVRGLKTLVLPVVGEGYVQLVGREQARAARKAGEVHEGEARARGVRVEYEEVAKA